MIARNQNRLQHRCRRVFAAICLLTVAFLYVPLAAAYWTSYSASCCASDHCPIKEHHHQKAAAPTTYHPAKHMDCGHEMSGVTVCTMSCCHNPDRPAVAAALFVLPFPLRATELVAVKRGIELSNPQDFLVSIEPLSPPPRLLPAIA